MLFFTPNPAPGRRFHQTVTIVLVAVFLWFPAFSADTPPLSPRLIIGTHHFTVEEARTPAQLEQGLMWRDHLAPDHGMLFIFPKPQVARMWMKDTRISLDMLFIDTAGKVLYIAHNTEPENYTTITAGVPVKAVLELPGGTCKKKGINVGDKVDHAVFDGTHP